MDCAAGRAEVQDAWKVVIAVKLLLTVETSWNQHRLVLGDSAGRLFDSHSDCTERPLELSDQILNGLETIGAQVRDIRAIAINIGPGGLSSIRTGIAFSNALAFSLSIPIYPFNYFQIVAKEILKMSDLPAIVAVPAAGDRAYVGLVRGGSVELMRFGSLASVVRAVGADLKEVAVVGRLRLQLLPLLRPAKVVDTMIETPDCRVLFEMGLAAWEQASVAADQVSPLNEESEIFHESS